MMRASPFVRHFHQQTRKSHRELELARAAGTPDGALLHLSRALALMEAATSMNQHAATRSASTPVLVATNSRDEPVSPAAVLECAPRLFLALEQMHQTIAVVFGYIHRESMFVQAGCSNMKEYAAKHLGVRTESAFDKLSRAGKAAWDAFPAECSSLIARVCKGEPPVSDGCPSLPTTSTLAALGTVLKWMPDRDAVIARVKSGEWTDKHLQREQAAHSRQLRAAVEQVTADAPAPVTLATRSTAGPTSALTAPRPPVPLEGDTAAATFFRRSLFYIEEATRLLENIYVGCAPRDGLPLIQERLDKLCVAVRGHVSPEWGAPAPVREYGGKLSSSRK